MDITPVQQKLCFVFAFRVVVLLHVLASVVFGAYHVFVVLALYFGVVSALVQKQYVSKSLHWSTIVWVIAFAQSFSRLN